MTADLWILLTATVLAVGVGSTAYFGSSRRANAFARSVASAFDGEVRDGWCRLRHRGVAVRVRQTRESPGGRTRSREILQVEREAPCPTWFTLSRTDAVLDRLGQVLGADTWAEPISDWHLPGYQMATTSPAWARAWLAQPPVRALLQTLTEQELTLLRLRPDGCECRCEYTGAAAQPPPSAVMQTLRLLLDTLDALAGTAHELPADLITPDDHAQPYTDRYGPLIVPFGLLALAALALLPVLALTQGAGALPWGAELELSGAGLLMLTVLPWFHTRLKAQARRREGTTDLYVAAMLLMITALLLSGIALSRPLVLLWMGG